MNTHTHTHTNTHTHTQNLAICGKMQKLYLHNTKIRRLNKSITYMYQLQVT